MYFGQSIQKKGKSSLYKKANAENQKSKEKLDIDYLEHGDLVM